jgi:hypothetical protein
MTVLDMYDLSDWQDWQLEFFVDASGQMDPDKLEDIKNELSKRLSLRREKKLDELLDE